MYLDSGCFLGCCLVLENSLGWNVMLLCNVTALAFCLNDLITHMHKEPKSDKMKTLIWLIFPSSLCGETHNACAELQTKKNDI